MRKLTSFMAAFMALFAIMLSTSFSMKADDIVWSSYPANGATINQVESILFSFEGAKSFSLDEDHAGMTAKFGSESAGLPTWNGINGFSYMKSAIPTSQSETVYTMKIDAGSFKIKMENGDVVSSPEINLTYNVKSSVVMPTQLTPAPFSTVESFNKIQLDFASTPEIDYEKLSTPPTIKCSDGTTYTYGADFWELDDANVFEFDNPITAKGVYTVSFPENFFLVSNVNTPAYTWQFTVGEQEAGPEITATFTPENGTSVEKVTSFKVATWTVDGEKAKSFALNGDASKKGEEYMTVTVDGKALTYDTDYYCYRTSINVASADLFKKGVVNVTIKPGFYNITMNDGTVYPSPEVNWTFTVTGPVAPQYTYTPEAGAFDDFPEVTLTYPAGTKITLKADAKAYARTYASGTTIDNVASKTPTATVDCDLAAADNEMLVTPSAVVAWKQYATYFLYIPAGSFTTTLNGTTMDNEDIYIAGYTLNQPKPDPMTLTPAAGSTVKAEDLSKIIISWPANGKTKYQSQSLSLYAIQLRAKGTTTALVKYNKVTKIDDYTIEVTPSAAFDPTTLPDGEYTLFYNKSGLSLNVNGVANIKYTDNLEFSYIIGEEPTPAVADIEITSTPANGSTVNEFEMLTLNFPEGVTFSMNEDNAVAGAITAKFNGADFQAPTVGRNDNQFSYRGVTLEAGEYEFSFVEGLYDVTLADGTKAISPAFTTKFTYAPVLVAPEFTYTPEAGAFDDFPEVTLTYPANTKITLKDDAKAYARTYASGTTLENVASKTPTATVDCDLVAADNEMLVTPTSVVAWKQYATYFLYIPAGSFTTTLNGATMDNEDIYIAGYTLNQPKPDPMTLTPAAGSTVKAEDLNEIIISWPENGKTKFQSASLSLYAPQIRAKGSTTAIVKYNKYTKIDDYSIKLTPSTPIDPANLPDGEYTFFYNKSALSLNVNGAANIKYTDNLEFEYTIKSEEPAPAVADIEITSTPANGSTVSEFEMLTLNFPEGVTFSMNEDNAVEGAITAKYNGADFQAPNVGRNDNQFSYRGVTLQPGEYEFSFVEGLYDVTLADGTKALSPAFTTKFTYAPAPVVAEIEITTTPANGSTVSEFESLVINFPEGVEFSLNEDVAVAGSITAKFNGQNFQTPSLSRKDNEFFYRGVTLEAGEYEFSFVEGFYNLTLADGTEALSPAFSTKFTYEPAVVPPTDVEILYTTTPADNSTLTNEEFKSVKVTFTSIDGNAVNENDIEVAYSDNVAPANYTIMVGDDVLQWAYDFECGEGANDPITEMILFEPIAAKDADVTVTIAEGFYDITYNGVTYPSPAITFSFKMTVNVGVDILTADGNNDVYTTTGILVIRNASAADVMNLPAGIYVINNKVYMKK